MMSEKLGLGKPVALGLMVVFMLIGIANVASTTAGKMYQSVNAIGFVGELHE